MNKIDTTDLVWKTIPVKLSTLIGLPNNPRKISPERKEILKKWLQKFNLVETPTINLDNTVISGNQRLQVLQKLYGLNYEIDVRVPNRLLNQTEVKELAITLNTHEGEFDTDIIKLEFNDIDLSDFNFDFNIDEWDGDDDNDISPNYSDKNKTINEDDLDDIVTMKLIWSLDDYVLVNSKLQELAETPEKAIWKLLNL